MKIKNKLFLTYWHSVSLRLCFLMLMKSAFGVQRPRKQSCLCFVGGQKVLFRSTFTSNLETSFGFCQKHFWLSFYIHLTHHPNPNTIFFFLITCWIVNTSPSSLRGKVFFSFLWTNFACICEMVVKNFQELIFCAYSYNFWIKINFKIIH